MQFIIYILAFIAIFLATLGFTNLLFAERRSLENRMKVFTTSLQHGERESNKGKKQSQPLTALFQQSSKVFAGKAIAKRMEGELSKADIPLKGEEFLMFNLISAAIPALFGFGVLKSVPAGIAFGACGLVLPRMLVTRTKHKRVAKFNTQIGEALTVMANSLRAGFSFLQTLDMVGKEMPAPIGVEFARCLREINLGTQTEQALVNLGQRIESDDLDLIITAVLIQRQVGGNLAEVLDSISLTIRERIRIKGEIKTLTAQGRLSGIIIGSMPIVLGLALLLISPGYIDPLFESDVGWGLVVAGLVSQAIGMILIKKVVNIQV